MAWSFFRSLEAATSCLRKGQSIGTVNRMRCRKHLRKGGTQSSPHSLSAKQWKCMPFWKNMISDRTLNKRYITARIIREQQQSLNISETMTNFTLISILFSITLVIQVSGDCDGSCVVTHSSCSPDSRVSRTTLTNSHVYGQSDVRTSTLVNSMVHDSHISEATMTGCTITRSTVRGGTYTNCVASDDDFSRC